MIYFTSDTHYNHVNICSGISKWKDIGKNRETRKFDTLEQMNQALVDRINERVKEDDELYHLGDWSFNGIESIWEFRKRLLCKNIHLILGNHDHHIENDRILPNCYWYNYNILNGSIKDNFESKIEGNTLLTNEVRVKDLFKSVQSVKTINYKGQKIFMSHYAHMIWEKSHKGVIHLFGHSHGTLNGLGKSMDVGVDTNNLYPYSIEEILEIMNKKEIHYIDQHSKFTN